jgi:hypothetical protein
MLSFTYLTNFLYSPADELLLHASKQLQNCLRLMNNLGEKCKSQVSQVDFLHCLSCPRYHKAVKAAVPVSNFEKHGTNEARAAHATLRHPCPRDHGFYGQPKGPGGSPRAGAQSAEARGLPSWAEGGP